ncbi:MAG TPA: hypothetical protein VK035_08325 [Kiloniellales bacterium]|nr:hypothetical protein [Kiloniellales bacterium]
MPDARLTAVRAYEVAPAWSGGVVGTRGHGEAELDVIVSLVERLLMTLRCDVLTVA